MMNCLEIQLDFEKYTHSISFFFVISSANLKHYLVDLNSRGTIFRAAAVSEFKSRAKYNPREFS